MKKFLTLFAFLTVFMGAKAEWVQVYEGDFSKNTGFPFFVMGYVPEWFDGIMTDFGAMYKYVEANDDATETSDVIVTTQGGVEYYKIALTDAEWHQYFIADGIRTNLDGVYKVKALVKASEACTINVNMGWGWGDGQQAGASVNIPASDEFQEVEWEYSGIGGSSCNLVAQPGTVTATIEWKSVTVFEDQREQRPIEWIENIENGDAEKSWEELGLAGTLYSDQENNYKICAWGKEKDVNVNDDGGWDPFPATIEVEPGNESNHVFVVHGKAATTEGDASAWDNQFWIQSPKGWKSGTQLKIKFRYKASKSVTVATQIHNQNPSDYLIYHAIGDIAFTEEWQEYDDIMTMDDDMNGGWSIAFQLNQNDKDPIDFYFDDLSWQNMKLDEGLFIASSNTQTGLEYDFDNAIEFEYDEDAEAYVATVGTEGKQDTWVNEVMISTIRGNDAAFKGATLKPSGAIVNDPYEWNNYTESSLAKIKLPAAGVWTISVDTERKQMNFVKIEGEEDKTPVEINPNTTEVVINALERNFTEAEGAGEDLPEDYVWGLPWDNQFWIVANRPLSAGEVTIVQFDYAATTDAKVSTQLHGDPGAYLHYAAIGDVNFSTDWQPFEYTLTVPSEADGMKSIAFNLSEIKEANQYKITNIVWKLEDGSESLIDMTGTKNFFVKELGNNPHEFGTDPSQPDVVGDVNGDGAVNVADISAIIDVMAGLGDEDAAAKADVNGDDAVNVADISAVITIMAETARKQILIAE